MVKDFLSVVVPVYNEEGNIEQLYNEIKESVNLLVKKKRLSGFEVIFVNDGSRDRTQEVLESMKKKDKRFLRVIQLRRNFGQTPGLKAGFDLSKGDLIVTMDGDLQNDPADIPKLIERLDQGYDVVSGWRYNRRDTFTKRIFSRMMNNLRMMVVGDRLHDYGCSLKMYKRECIKDLQLFGELHRYVTAYLYIKGYRIGELRVNHRARGSGVTKYKFNRGLNGILDLFYLKFWAVYSHKPLHLFGRLGVYQLIVAAFIGFEQIIKAIIINELKLGPLLGLASVLVVSGLLFIMFGFLAEMIMRSYFKEEKIYSIRKII